MQPLLFDTPFGISIDLSFWQDFILFSSYEKFTAIFAVILWWLLAIILFNKAVFEWQAFKQKEYTDTWKWVVLAVDIPAPFIGSPKSVEQIFVQLSGAHVNYGVYDRYFLGKVPKWFSFEIISIEGYIQFLVRAEVELRDLIEASIYAQFAEAEITEVEDYTAGMFEDMVNNEYQAQGVEFCLAENEVYPIRTYPDFEYSISKDMVFTDPMGAILENFTRVGAGEHLWMQMIIVPVDNSWKQAGIDLVKKIIAGKKEAPKSGLVSAIGAAPEAILKTAIQAWTYNFETDEKAKKKEETVGKISDLTPGTKAVIESIEDKISKIGFKSFLRAVYVSKKDNFQPHKCLHGLIGAMNQFSINNRNGFKAKTVVGEKIVKVFKDRKLKNKDEPYVLNIEELATIWHFPMPSVKTPLLQKADIKHGEPPINLPMENFEAPLRRKPVGPAKQEEIESPDEEDLPYA
jgi:hypothetical protein